MALVNCPDCGVDVSDQAELCPNCNRPNPAVSDSVIEAENSSNQSAAYWLGYFLALVIFIVKYGFMKGILFGWIVAFLSWFYVIFATIQAIFT